MIVLVAASYLFFINHRTAFNLTNTKPTASGDAQHTTSTSANQGSATDNKGQTTSPVTTSPNQWQQSQSGLLTVQQPAVNATLVTGFTLSGTASVDGIHYRLSDDKVGVISQGTITLVDGKFSATINFKTSAKTGRLDVFNTDSLGKELNEVQIAVNFGA